MVYLRYSSFDAIIERSIIIDSHPLKRFSNISDAESWVNRKEAGRFPLLSGTLFRKGKGREINLKAYSRDEHNDLRVTPLV